MMPRARLRSAPAGPQAFKRMVGEIDRAAKPGDLLLVEDKTGAPYGVAFYNPKSLITLRIITRRHEGFDPEAFFAERIARAVELRRDVLGLEASTDAYRLVYDQGDGLPGLVIDRYGDCFVVEFYALGMFKQAERIERLLSSHFPGARFVRRASRHTETMEGFRVEEAEDSTVRVRENGVLFEVHPSGGYKTGFFCDQRENRLAFARMASGKRVLDVCSYTGGFGVYAMKAGGAKEATLVELDPEASALGQRNANINGVKARSVCVDAFPYLRQAASNQERWDLVALDPHKLIGSREGYDEGRQKYVDLNRLAISVVAEGGILLTCSCSGLFPWEEFQKAVRTAAGSTGRRVQVLRKSGAGADHPVSTDYPEGEYLKALWCRVL